MIILLMQCVWFKSNMQLIADAGVNVELQQPTQAQDSVDDNEFNNNCDLQSDQEIGKFFYTCFEV